MPVRNDQVFPRSVRYSVGTTASTGPFSIPFPFADNDQVAVLVDGLPVTDFVITKPDLYGVTGNEVTLAVAVSSVDVVVYSNTAERRNTADSFTNSELSKEIDRIYAIDQENAEQIARSLKLEIATTTDAEVEAPVAGRLLRARADGKGWENGPLVTEIDALNADAIEVPNGAYSGLTVNAALDDLEARDVPQDHGVGGNNVTPIDWNADSPGGLYHGNALAGETPYKTHSWQHTLIQRHNANYHFELARGFGAGDSLSHRVNVAGTWSGWRKVIDTNDVLPSPMFQNAAGDGTTDDSAELTAAHGNGKPVNYMDRTYGADETTYYFNLYGATKYKAASGTQIRYGRSAAPVDDPEPVKATVKFTKATRAVDTSAWDQVGYYGLIKKSGDAYGTALSGYARGQDGAGDIIGVHGRIRLDALNTGRGYAGWFYAEAFGAGRTAHTLELNTYADTDQGHHSGGGRYQAVRICPADNTADANRVSSFISMGPNNTGGTNNGAWTGLHFEANSILRTAGVDDLGEVMLVDAPTVSTGHVGGLTFRSNGQPGVFKHALRTKEASFANSVAIYMAAGQRIRWNDHAAGPSLTGGTNVVTLEKGFLHITDPQAASVTAMQVNGLKVLSTRQVIAALGNTPNSGDATTDALIDALRDVIVAHGLGAAA